MTEADLVVPGAGRAREPPRSSPPPRRRDGRWSARSSSPTGGSRTRPGGPRPLLAVTGTDGKTTTTLLAVAMLEAGGVRAVAAGNTDVPLVTAVDDEEHRRLRRRVHELPAGVDRAVPGGRRGVAQPRRGSPQLARLDGDVRSRQGAHLQPAAPDGRGDRVRRRSGGDGPPPGRPGPAAHVRAGRRRLPRRRTGPRDRARRTRPGPSPSRQHCPAPCPTISPTGSPPPRSSSRPVSSEPDAVADGVGDVHRSTAPHRARRRRRWRAAGSTTPRPRPLTPPRPRSAPSTTSS